jgi:hypothetical protein
MPDDQEIRAEQAREFDALIRTLPNWSLRLLILLTRTIREPRAEKPPRSSYH